MGYFCGIIYFVVSLPKLKNFFLRHDHEWKKPLKAAQLPAISEVITISLNFLNVGPICRTHRRKEAPHIGQTFLNFPTFYFHVGLVFNDLYKVQVLFISLWSHSIKTSKSVTEYDVYIIGFLGWIIP